MCCRGFGGGGFEQAFDDTEVKAEMWVQGRLPSRLVRLQPAAYHLLALGAPSWARPACRNLKDAPRQQARSETHHEPAPPHPHVNGRWNPTRVGLSVAGTLLTLFLIVELAIGRLPGIPAVDGPDAWIAIVHFLLLGGMVAAYLTAAGLGRASFEGLRANFPGDHEARLQYVPASRTSIAMSGLVGLFLVGVLTPFLTAALPWSPSTWTPEVYWHRMIGTVLGLFTGMTLFVYTRESLLVSRAAARIEPVDLFEPERFAPVVRHGLTNGLLAVILTSLGGLFLLDPGQVRAVGPVWGVVLPVMIGGIVLPAWGARSGLRRAKQREMEWALEGIRESRAKDPVDTGRLGALSAYHEMVRQAPEWPFTPSSYVRAAFYFLIPAGAWLVAVVIEALLQATLLGG